MPDNFLDKAKQEWQRLQKELKQNPGSRKPLYELSSLYTQITENIDNTANTPKETQQQNKLLKAIEKKYGLNENKAYFNVAQGKIRVLQEALATHLKRQTYGSNRPLYNTYLQNELTKTINQIDNWVKSDSKDCPWKQLKQKAEDWKSRHLGKVENDIIKPHQEFLSLINLIEIADPYLQPELIQRLEKLKLKIENNINNLVQSHAQNTYSLLTTLSDQYLSDVNNLCNCYRGQLQQKYPHINPAEIDSAVSHLQNTFINNNPQWNFNHYTNVGEWAGGVHGGWDYEGQNSYLDYSIHQDALQLDTKQEKVNQYFTSLFNLQGFVEPHSSRENSDAIRSLFSQDQNLLQDMQNLGEKLCSTLEIYRSNVNSTAEILRQQHPNDYVWFYAYQDITIGWDEIGQKRINQSNENFPDNVIEEANQLWQMHSTLEGLQTKYRTIEKLLALDSKSTDWHGALQQTAQEINNFVKANPSLEDSREHPTINEFDISRQSRKLEKLQSSIEKTCNHYGLTTSSVQKQEKLVQETSEKQPQVSQESLESSLFRNALRFVKGESTFYKAQQEWGTLQETFKNNVATAHKIDADKKRQAPSLEGKTEHLDNDTIKTLQQKLSQTDFDPDSDFKLETANDGFFDELKGFIRCNSSSPYDIPLLHCTSEQNPWKIHVSIPNFEDIIPALKALSPILIEKYDVTFKIIKEKTFKQWNSSESPSQNGKIFTIYPRDIETMKKMIPEIETALQEAKITPGLSPQSDLRVGNYCYVRDSYDAYGDYIDAKKMMENKDDNIGRWGNRFKTYVDMDKEDPFKENTTNDPDLGNIADILNRLGECRAILQENTKPNSAEQKAILDEVNKAWEQNLTSLDEWAQQTPDSLLRHKILRSVTPYKSDVQQNLTKPAQGQEALERLVRLGITNGVEFDQALEQVVKKTKLGTEVETKLKTQVINLQRQGKNPDEILKTINKELQKAHQQKSNNKLATPQIGGLTSQSTKPFIGSSSSEFVTGNGTGNDSSFHTHGSEPFNPAQDPSYTVDLHPFTANLKPGKNIVVPGMKFDKETIKQKGAFFLPTEGATDFQPLGHLTSIPATPPLEFTQPSHPNNLPSHPDEKTVIDPGEYIALAQKTNQTLKEIERSQANLAEFRQKKLKVDYDIEQTYYDAQLQKLDALMAQQNKSQDALLKAQTSESIVASTQEKSDFDYPPLVMTQQAKAALSKTYQQQNLNAKAKQAVFKLKTRAMVNKFYHQAQAQNNATMSQKAPVYATANQGHSSSTSGGNTNVTPRLPVAPITNHGNSYSEGRTTSLIVNNRGSSLPPVQQNTSSSNGRSPSPAKGNTPSSGYQGFTSSMNANTVKGANGYLAIKFLYNVGKNLYVHVDPTSTDKERTDASTNLTVAGGSLLAFKEFAKRCPKSAGVVAVVVTGWDIGSWVGDKWDTKYAEDGDLFCALVNMGVGSHFVSPDSYGEKRVWDFEQTDSGSWRVAAIPFEQTIPGLQQKIAHMKDYNAYLAQIVALQEKTIGLLEKHIEKVSAIRQRYKKETARLKHANNLLSQIVKEKQVVIDKLQKIIAFYHQKDQAQQKALDLIAPDVAYYSEFANDYKQWAHAHHKRVMDTKQDFISLQKGVQKLSTMIENSKDGFKELADLTNEMKQCVELLQTKPVALSERQSKEHQDLLTQFEGKYAPKKQSSFSWLPIKFPSLQSAYLDKQLSSQNNTGAVKSKVMAPQNPKTSNVPMVFSER